MHYNLQDHPPPPPPPPPLPLSPWEIVNGKCRPVPYTVSALTKTFTPPDNVDINSERDSNTSEVGYSTDDSECRMSINDFGLGIF